MQFLCLLHCFSLGESILNVRNNMTAFFLTLLEAFEVNILLFFTKNCIDHENVKLCLKSIILLYSTSNVLYTVT